MITSSAYNSNNNFGRQLEDTKCLKSWYKPEVMKTAWCLSKCGLTDLWSHTEWSEMNLHLNGQLMLDKHTKAIPKGL